MILKTASFMSVWIVLLMHTSLANEASASLVCSPQVSASNNSETKCLTSLTGTVEKIQPQIQATAPPGAPNVLIVLTDDVGFSASSTFGGPIPTPSLDRIAKRGLVFNRFHTAGVCAPTRAALLTGRNHHAVGMGHHPEMASPYAGYQGFISKDSASIASVLRDGGYNTAMFGKDHNTPPTHRSSSGPFDHWPTGRGFEHFYGFLTGDTDQYHPALFSGHEIADTSDWSGDYLLDEDLINRATHWLHNQKATHPDRPFFIYYAPGSAHAPQQAPKEWIKKFKGRFDHGWDEERNLILERQKQMGLVPKTTVLPPRPKEVQSWESLSEDERTVYARFMEVYAAMLSYQDHQFGRLLNEMERLGLADNTLIIFIQGDNGGAVGNGIYGSVNEILDMARPTNTPQYNIAWLAKNIDVLGSRRTYQAIPAGWALAVNTPFPYFKRIASHLGAVRNGLVISWPAKIEQHGLRQQYHHVVDIMPTVLDAVGLEMPIKFAGIQQKKLDGVSMTYSFEAPQAKSRRQSQYYEISGNRALYHDGWLANTHPPLMPWVKNRSKATKPDDYEWELYHIDKDFSQSRDVAHLYPEKLDVMRAMFDTEARDNQVYPLQNSSGRERAIERGALNSRRKELIFWGPNVRVLHHLAPPIFSHNFSITADLEVHDSTSNGVIFAAGSHFGGWSVFLKNGIPTVSASSSPLETGEQQVSSKHPLTAGRHTIAVAISHNRESSNVSFIINGEAIRAQTVAPRPLRLAGQGETFDSGRDTNVPVSGSYVDGGKFPGTIHKIVVNLDD